MADETNQTAESLLKEMSETMDTLLSVMGEEHPGTYRHCDGCDAVKAGNALQQKYKNWLAAREAVPHA